MRLFAAVVPPASALAEVARVARLLDVSTLRLVPDHQRHITVAFYADVANGRVDELVDRLGRAGARTPPLSLRLSGLGTFPANADRARMLWAGVDGDTDELARLAERSTAAGRRVGVESESRKYRPHLTLGRSRAGALDLRDIVATGLSSATWTARELTLFRSTLGATVTHDILAVLPLSAGSGQP